MIKYTKLKEIGRGRFGITYTVVDEDSGLTILMKQIPKGGVKRTAILREVAILEKIKNVCDEFIVCYIGFQEDANNYYIFTEYYGNYMTLKDYFKNYRPSIFQQKTIFYNLLQGLQTIHEVGIIHRDIKPENILIDPQSLDVKYIDFGLSCEIQDANCLYGLKGTPYYLSPELYQQEEIKINEKILGQREVKPFLPIDAYYASDIWSLGLVFFYLIEKYQPLFKFKSKDSLSDYLLDLIKYDSEIFELRNISTTNFQNLVRMMLKPRWRDRATIKDLLNMLTF